MATVVVGGLVTSTILTLIVLPCIYLVWHKWLDRKKTPEVENPHSVE